MSFHNVGMYMGLLVKLFLYLLMINKDFCLWAGITQRKIVYDT